MRYIPVKASIVGLRNHLARLQKRGIISVDKQGRYKLKSCSYPPQRTQQKNWQEIVHSAKKHTRLLRAIPFIKSIVVLPQSDERSIRIAVIALPARLHLARLLVEKFFASRTLENSQKKQIEVIDTLYFTTAGLRFLDDFGFSDLDRTVCLLNAKPIFGEKVWQTMLEKNDYIRTQCPNYIWARNHTAVYASSIRFLDSYDDKAYRAFLRSMARKKSTATVEPYYEFGPMLLLPTHMPKRKRYLANAFLRPCKR